MEKKKLTKKEYFAVIKEVVRGAVPEGDAGVAANGVTVTRGELTDFIDREIELLANKSKKTGNTKAEKEAAERFETVIAELTAIGKPVTISELMRESAVFSGDIENWSSQRLSAILNKEAKAKDHTPAVVRTEEKGKAYFSIA